MGILYLGSVKIGSDVKVKYKIQFDLNSEGFLILCCSTVENT